MTVPKGLGKHGYLGPIGDDFPSLFPLLLGLLIFFSSLAAAYMVYDNKDATVKSMRANIMISRAVRYQITFDKDYWDFACNLSMGMKLNYNIHLAMWLEYYTKNGFEVVNFGKYSQKYAICPPVSSSTGHQIWGYSLPTSSPTLSSSYLYNQIANITSGRHGIVMSYPVIWVNKTTVSSSGMGGNTQTYNVYVPARLVVVTWK